MAKNKTTENEASVDEYLAAIPDTKRREDCTRIITLLSEAIALKPKMWGTGIVGFGSYHYKYDSGHEGSAPLAGLASRSNAIVLYLADDPERKDKFLAKLGKHKTGKGCIYIKTFSDIDAAVLSQMAQNSVEYLKATYQLSSNRNI